MLDAFELYAPAAMPYHQPAVCKHPHVGSFQEKKRSFPILVPTKAGGTLNAVSEHDPLVKLICTLKSSEQPT
jgi:hypothetical protein